jgi:hypothetical protein
VLDDPGDGEERPPREDARGIHHTVVTSQRLDQLRWKRQPEGGLGCDFVPPPRRGWIFPVVHFGFVHGSRS